jgi:hypothetical protein
MLRCREGKELKTRSLAVLALAGALVCGVAHKARAEPAWGVNCLSCHDEWVTDALVLFGEDAVADPDESATGAPDRGPLPVFRVPPGEFRTMQVEVTGLDDNDVYAVELKRLRFPGVVSGHELAYSDDCSWAYWGEPGKYYTDPAVGYSWGIGPTTFAFEVGAHADTPEDYYDLVFAVVGKREDGSLFSSEVHFYLDVTSTALLGDFDSDGDVDVVDFNTFAACFDGAGQRAEVGCDPCDLDADLDVDCVDWLTFRGAWTAPEDPPEFPLCAGAIPAIPQWGVVVMTLLLVVAATIVMSPRARHACASTNLRRRARTFAGRRGMGRSDGV